MERAFLVLISDRMGSFALYSNLKHEMSMLSERPLRLMCLRSLGALHILLISRVHHTTRKCTATS